MKPKTYFCLHLLLFLTKFDSIEINFKKIEKLNINHLVRLVFFLSVVWETRPQFHVPGLAMSRLLVPGSAQYCPWESLADLDFD